MTSNFCQSLSLGVEFSFSFLCLALKSLVMESASLNVNTADRFAAVFFSSYLCLFFFRKSNAQYFLLIPVNSKKLKRPKPWKHTQAITLEQLKQMREEFWDTAPHYGGQKGTATCILQLLASPDSTLLFVFICESVMRLYCLLDQSVLNVEPVMHLYRLLDQSLFYF